MLLSIKYSSYGHALWEPSPGEPNNPVKVGDVGFIRDGQFHRLFNALLSAEDQSDVPEHYEQLVPKFSKHVRKSTLSSNHYCSDGINVELESNIQAFGPDDYDRISFTSPRRRGAVLSLPIDARREDTLAKGDFSGWMVKQIDRWFAFARDLGLGIERMEEIILVTGCDHARSWTNIAFFGNQNNLQASFGVKVTHGPPISINWQPSHERVRGAVLHRGPGGTNLPDDQCVFIRGFRVARTFWILPKHLKAAAGPSPDGEGCDGEPDIEVVSIPMNSKYRDPLHLLQEYVAERAPDSDMVLVHDIDLVTINELSHGNSPESLEPDVMIDLLRRSNIEIHRVSFDLSPTSGSTTESSTVEVAMLSTTFQNWNTASPSQWPHLLPVPTIRGETNKREPPPQADHRGNALFTQEEGLDETLRLAAAVLATQVLRKLSSCLKEILVFGKTRISLSNVWPSLSKFAPVKRKRLLTVIVTCCSASLLGWIFQFTWDFIFRLFFALLASFPLSAWLEREYRSRRRVTRVEERLEALQHCIVSSQLNPTVPGVVDDVRDSLPIKASPNIRSPIANTQTPLPRPLLKRPISSPTLAASSHSRPPTPHPHGDSPVRRRSAKSKSRRSPSLSSSLSSSNPVTSSHSRPPAPRSHSPVPAVRRRSTKSKSPRSPSLSSSLSSPAQVTSSNSHPPMPRSNSLVRRRSTKSKSPRPPSLSPSVVSHVPFQSVSDPPLPPSPPVNIQRTRSSNFFSRIKSSFPLRPPSPPDPSSHATTMLIHTHSSPSTDVLRKPPSSNFFNRIKYAFAPRPPSPHALDRENALSRTHSITASISRTRSLIASVSRTRSTPPFSQATTTPSSPLPSLQHQEEPASFESF